MTTSRSNRTFPLVCLAVTALAAVGALGACAGSGSAGRSGNESASSAGGSDGPADQGTRVARQDGDANRGREVFRTETFGNERFWTDAVRLPQGMMAAKVTPLQALELGIQVNVDAIPAAMRQKLAAELAADPTGRTSPMMNDPMVTAALVSANAVIGMPIKDSNGDGVMDATRGDKAGASCALCHAMTDGSTFKSPKGGSVGHEIDGLANHDLNLGKIFATAANTRALYPVAQLALKANGGKTLGRAPTGLTGESTEADFDAYFSNPAFYPIGMFDDTFDGNGDPMHNTPLFRQDLAAPFGSEGTIARVDNFSNLVFTTLFEQTNLTTPGGRAFIHKVGGAAGDEMVDTYVKILAATNVTGYPYVKASPHPQPGSEDAPVGVRVNNDDLLAMNAYLVKLQAPRAAAGDGAMRARGREVFRTAGCTTCHNVDQSRPVPATIHPMATIFPGDAPMTLAQREPPLNPVVNTADNIFDDKMAVFNASIRGEKRGIALPLLLDLARKPVFLHDNSVPSLERLLDPVRGATMPHPFYVADGGQRAAVVAYLKGLDTGSR